MPQGAKLAAWAALLLGIAAVLVLTAWQGFDTVVTAFESLGAGFLLLLLLVGPHLVLATWSWRLLFLPGRAPGFGAAIRANWIALSVDTLVPLASVGGEIVKVRLVMLAGVPAVDAVASVVADKSVQAISIVIWGLTGALTLVLLQTGDELIVPVLMGAALLTVGTAGFVAVLVSGAAGRLVRRGVGAMWAGLLRNASAFDATIRGLYRDAGRIGLAVALRFCARVALTLEIWLIAQAMGLPIGLLEALALKSLVGALRGAAFFVPGGWGLQEGGFMLLGSLFGLSPDASLALSLITRAREIVVGLLGMALWQRIEGRSWRSRLAGE